MKKTAIWGGVAGGVASVIVVGGSVWSGSVSQHRLQNEWGHLEKVLPLKISEAAYERGIFSSKYTFKIHAGCDQDAAVNSPALTVRQRIQHGPVPGFTSLGRVAIDTEIDTPSELRTLLKNGAEASTLIKAHTLLNLLGGGVTQISTAALEFEEQNKKTQLSVKALLLQIRHAANGQIHYELNWPGMSAVSREEGAAGNMNIDALSVRGETRFDENNPLGFVMDTSSSELKSLMVLGHVHGNQTKIAFSNIKTDSKTSLENGLFNNVSHLDAQASINNTPIPKLRLNTSFKRIHAGTYAQILQTIFHPGMLCGSATGLEASAVQGEAIMAAGAALLTHNPEFSVDALELDMDGLSGKMAYAFGVQGLTAEDLNGSAGPLFGEAVARKAYASGHIEIPTPWLEKIMVDATPTRQAQDQAMLEAMITQAIDEGYVKREGQMLSSQFKMENGVLKVNDKSMGPFLGL